MAEESPDWIRDALHQLVDELSLFVRTAVAFTLRPRAFAESWTSGRGRRLNPLGFAATAFAVIAPLGTALSRLWPEGPEPQSLTNDLLAWLLPFGYFVLLGVLQHGTLRALGSRRPLRDSCAMALYAGGGPAMVGELVAVLLFVLAHRLGWSPTYRWADLVHSWRARAFTLVATLSVTAFFVTLALVQARLHRARPWKVLAATLVAIVGSGLFFGMVKPPGMYGMHAKIEVHHDGGAWAVNFGLGT